VSARRVRLALVIALLTACVAASAADARQWSWLGVRIRDLSEQEMEEIAAKHGIREGFGVVIVEVIEGAPAATAGLRAGDIVVAFDDRPVTETRLLQRLIAAAAPGAESRLTVLREDGRRRVAVRLAPMPRAVVGERVAAELGFIVREPDPPGEARREGAVAPAITTVLRDSAAEKAGLAAGDVILQVNEQAVVSREAVREALADVNPDRPLRLTIRRGASHLSITLEVRQ
jgi:S1-C subfamily serine protease